MNKQASIFTLFPITLPVQSQRSDKSRANIHNACLQDLDKMALRKRVIGYAEIPADVSACVSFFISILFFLGIYV